MTVRINVLFQINAGDVTEFSVHSPVLSIWPFPARPFRRARVCGRHLLAFLMGQLLALPDHSGAAGKICHCCWQKHPPQQEQPLTWRGGGLLARGYVPHCVLPAPEHPVGPAEASLSFPLPGSCPLTSSQGAPQKPPQGAQPTALALRDFRFPTPSLCQVSLFCWNQSPQGPGSVFLLCPFLEPRAG